MFFQTAGAAVTVVALLFSRRVSIITMRGGKTIKVAKIARQTSITVTSPKLLKMGNGENIRAENPKTVVAPEAIRLSLW